MNKNRFVEMGMLGGKASAIASKKRKQMRIDAWNKNPKLCLFCGKSLQYYQRKNTYCSHSCAALINNYKYPKRATKKKNLVCLYCETPLNRTQVSYCSLKCFNDNKWRNTTTKIETYRFIPDKNRRTARKYLIYKHGHECQICHNTHWNNKDIPLTVDHIDGNYENGYLDNLRIICPNCDAQLPTYKGANKGRGRKYRRN